MFKTSLLTLLNSSIIFTFAVETDQEDLLDIGLDSIWQTGQSPPLDGILDRQLTPFISYGDSFAYVCTNQASPSSILR
jgi:hypothetical protein